jgi:signal peptidase I
MKDMGAKMEDMKQNNGEEKKEKGSTSAVREIFGWVFSFALAFIVAILLKNYVIINADVPTGSMENTIMPGDRLIGNRLIYLRNDPERGDVVIFRYPDNEEDLYVKRIIGLPGETVDIDEGIVYINGEVLEEDYLKETWTVATGPYHFEIPDGCYLMLGDNRNDSWDARYWTNSYVEKDKILGKAWVVYWPKADMGKIE